MCNSKKLEEQRQAKLFGWETCPEDDYDGWSAIRKLQQPLTHIGRVLLPQSNSLSRPSSSPETPIFVPIA
jgi:hypothetical protein